MSSDYLWDKTGRDPEVEALERLLAPAALGAARSRKSRSLAWIAGVAAAALFAVGAFQALRRPAPVESPSVRRPAPVESTWVVQKDGRSVLDLGRYGTVVAEKDAAVVTWDRVGGADRYVVLRGVGETPWAAEYQPVAKGLIRAAEFADREAPRGKPATTLHQRSNRYSSLPRP